MRRLVLAALAIVAAVIAGASCVRHVELTRGNPPIDAPFTPDASVDASIDAATVDASFTSPDAPPDSSIDAL